MEVLDCTNEEEFDRILDEAPPCPECCSKDYLATGVITAGDKAGTVLVLCVLCGGDFEEEEESQQFVC